MEIRSSFKKLLFDRIKENALEPKHFVTRSIEPDQFEIRYKDSYLYFTFIIYPDDYNSLKHRYTVYSLNRKEITPLNNWSSVAGAIATFNRWLKEVVSKYVEDENTVDPWEEIGNEMHNFFTQDNEEKFSAEEVRVIESRLIDFETFAAKKLLLDQEKLDVLIQEVRDLRQEIKNPKITKKKWLRNFKGFLMQEIWEIIKDHDKRHLAIEYFKTMFDSVRHFLQ